MDFFHVLMFHVALAVFRLTHLLAVILALALVTGPVIMDSCYVTDILIDGEPSMCFQILFYCFKTFIKISFSHDKKIRTF